MAFSIRGALSGLAPSTFPPGVAAGGLLAGEALIVAGTVQLIRKGGAVGIFGGILALVELGWLYSTPLGQDTVSAVRTVFNTAGGLLQKGAGNTGGGSGA